MGVRSGECAGHGVGVFLLRIRAPKWSVSHCGAIWKCEPEPHLAETHMCRSGYCVAFGDDAAVGGGRDLQRCLKPRVEGAAAVQKGGRNPAEGDGQRQGTFIEGTLKLSMYDRL